MSAATLKNLSQGHSPKVDGCRAYSAEETFSRISPLLRKAGISRVADVTGLDHLGIPVVMVIRPNSRALAVSQGKGLNLLAAKVSGAMEGLESFHAERLDLPVFLARWSELAGTDRAVDPASLPAKRNSLFHPDKRLLWTSAIDIVNGKVRLIPLELVHTDFTLPAPPGSGCFPMSSNGVASGNSLAEAVVHGMCEVIERDAEALSRSRPEFRPRTVLMSTATDPVILSLVERIENAGCQLVVADLTSDIGVPVFSATIWGGGASPITAAPACGFGCHPDRAWACVRAITEAAQSRLTRLAGSRDDLISGWFRIGLVPLTQASDAAAVPFGAEPSFSGETVEDDLLWIVGRLAQRGIYEVFVVDLGLPEFNVPVVRIVIPGLEHPPGDDVLLGKRAQRAP